ncbi:hypothetical protein FOCC_FOCC001590 [Frankliniella occidentalis]|nr:hypothetical protein FOCC_FOCC001590 [Frankliniella occidentalis]
MKVSLLSMHGELLGKLIVFHSPLLSMRSPNVLIPSVFHSSIISRSSLLITCDPRSGVFFMNSRENLLVVESKASFLQWCEEKVRMEPMFSLPDKIYQVFMDGVDKFLRYGISVQKISLHDASKEWFNRDNVERSSNWVTLTESNHEQEGWE